MSARGDDGNTLAMENLLSVMRDTAATLSRLGEHGDFGVPGRVHGILALDSVLL